MSTFLDIQFSPVLDSSLEKDIFDTKFFQSKWSTEPSPNDQITSTLAALKFKEPATSSRDSQPSSESSKPMKERVTTQSSPTSPELDLLELSTPKSPKDSVLISPGCIRDNQWSWPLFFNPSGEK